MIATIGITDFAQQSLGDITFLELPSEGDEVKKDDPVGVIESVKAVSDIYAPVTGKVIEVNTSLIETPERLNDDPYTDGWLVKIETKEPKPELEGLMSAKEYEQFVEEKA